MKRAFADGTLIAEKKNNKLQLYRKADGAKSDRIIGYQKMNGTGKSFDKVFLPIYYKEAPGPEDCDAGNVRNNSDIQKYMFEVSTNKVKIWIGSNKNKNYLAEFSY